MDIDVSSIFASLSLKEEVEIISRNVIGTDKWGDNEVNEVSETVQGYLQKIEQKERLALQGDLRTAVAKCYLAPGTSVNKNDVISYQSNRYVIIGEPFVYRAQIEIWLKREVN